MKKALFDAIAGRDSPDEKSKVITDLDWEMIFCRIPILFEFTLEVRIFLTGPIMNLKPTFIGALFAIVVALVPIQSIAQQVTYSANWPASDFSQFDPNGGTINVLYETDDHIGTKLPENFFLSFEFEMFTNQIFSFNYTSFDFALEIFVNEGFSSTVQDSSFLTVEAAPVFPDWSEPIRFLDQAGMSLLGLYKDPKSGKKLFYETLFLADEITDPPPGEETFKAFNLTYLNLVSPEIPAEVVCSASYTLFSDLITYERMLVGDVNCDGLVDLLDVAPFILAISGSEYVEKADINRDGTVDLLDVEPFVDVLSGN